MKRTEVELPRHPRRDGAAAAPFRSRFPPFPSSPSDGGKDCRGRPERGRRQERSRRRPLGPPLTEEQERDRRNNLETVLCRSAGRCDAFGSGTLGESPVRRPSYGSWSTRETPICERKDRPNLSGGDWKNVASLIAGAPRSGQAGTPSFRPRPTVTRRGEVIAAVPRAVRPRLPQETRGKPARRLANAGRRTREVKAASSGRDADKKAWAARRGEWLRPRRFARPRSPVPAPKMGAPRRRGAGVSPPRATAAPLAAAYPPWGGGSTRYTTSRARCDPQPQREQLGAHSCRAASRAGTLSRRARRASRPRAGHPFRVARFLRGAVGSSSAGRSLACSKGAHLPHDGGWWIRTPAGATATVPFALERAIAVDLDRKFDELGGRRLAR